MKTRTFSWGVRVVVRQPVGNGRPGEDWSPLASLVVTWIPREVAAARFGRHEVDAGRAAARTAAGAGARAAAAGHGDHAAAAGARCRVVRAASARIAALGEQSEPEEHRTQGRPAEPVPPSERSVCAHPLQIVRAGPCGVNAGSLDPPQSEVMLACYGFTASGNFRSCRIVSLKVWALISCQPRT